MSNAGKKQGFGANVAWMAGGNWGEHIISFLIYVALARILGAETFGLVAMASALVILAEAMVRETLTEWLIAEKDPEAGHFDALFWTLGGVSLVIFAGLYFGAGLIAGAMGEPQIAPLIQALAVVVPMTGFTGVPVAILRRKARFDILGARAVVGVVVGGSVGLAMALGGAGAWSLVVFRILLVAANEIMAWYFAGWRPGFSGRLHHLHSFLSMGLSTFWLQAAYLVSIQSATVIFGAMLGPVAAGFFSLAWRLTEILTFLVNVPFAMVSQTAFAATKRRGDDVTGFMDNVLSVTILPSLAVFSGLAVLAGPFIRFCFGEEWVPAAAIVQVLCIVGLYRAVERIQHVFCLAMGQAKGLAVITTIEAIAGIVVMVLLVPYGAVAVTLGFAIRYLVFWPLRFSYAARFGAVSMGRTVALVAPGLLAALTMVAVLLGLIHGVGLDPYRLGWMGVLILAGAVTFAGFVALFLPNRIETARRLVGWETASASEGGKT
jgi:O-antigen/teichoic acid export membrane protein